MAKGPRFIISLEHRTRYVGEHNGRIGDSRLHQRQLSPQGEGVCFSACVKCGRVHPVEAKVKIWAEDSIFFACSCMRMAPEELLLVPWRSKPPFMQSSP
ncbi:hypothetical protein H5410_028294 [Solanum commersonii]|uniref:Uncharacterized protein n=1 Tax=Solanum commersonii TaxID=4109 RepID=A0A9J5Z298_SOLCO|nr:hypothetical protein H5410_028294 [Solanum commersonii]